jgi:hypothetical protein
MQRLRANTMTNYIITAEQLKALRSALVLADFLHGVYDYAGEPHMKSIDKITIENAFSNFDQVKYKQVTEEIV